MDSYGLQLLSSAGPEPIPLDLAKAHLRVDGDDEDDEITLLCAAVRKFFEKSCEQALVPENWLLTLDHFPNWEGVAINDYQKLWDLIGIRLPRSPVPARGTTQVNFIQYIDPAGNLQTVDPSIYLVDASTVPVRIAPAFGQIWPIARYQMAAVSVSYTIAPVVDEDIKLGMLLLLSHWFQNREAVLAGAYAQVPLGVQSILALNWDGSYGGRHN